MTLYRFSPIKNESELTKAIYYLIEQGNKLANKVVGTILPISYLTVFAHYGDEYERLITILKSWGNTEIANNGLKAKLKNPITANGQQIYEIRIRKPDPYRMQVGCCDFRVDDYNTFKNEQLKSNPNLRVIERKDYEMIEFYHPNFDVLAYVVSP